MKIQKAILGAVAILSLASATNTFAAEKRLRLWGEIPFIATGNFHEFEATMKKTRDESRRQLWEEFGSLYLPSVMYGAEAASAAQALASVLITFDRLRDEHVARANEGIPEALERQLLAAFDQLYRNQGLTEEERRAEFIRFNGWNEAMGRLRRGQITSAERDRLFLELFQGVDYVLYGSYTVLDQGAVALTLTAEKFATGEQRTFQARGRLQDAIQMVAAELFEFVQANRRSPWKNPLEGLEWVLPPKNLPGTQLPREAKMFCDGQGARIPFARELILAAQGGNYRSGGIPSIGDSDIYLVADLQRTVENHFYFGRYHTGEDPRGPVRTDAGYGRILPNFVCVRGEVAEPVRWEQDLYRVYRKTEQMSEAKRERVQQAIEFLLIRLDAYGTRSWFEKNFNSAKQATRVLQTEGITITDALRSKLENLE